MHLRFLSADKKIRASSVAFIGSLFARISIPNYLIFSRFYLKNRTTTDPTPKSLFFNDFNARRGIAIPNSNSMVNDGNYPVQITKGTNIRAKSSRPIQREIKQHSTPNSLVFVIIPEINPVVKQIRTNVLIFIFAKTIVSS